MAGRTTGCDPYKAVPLKADDGCQPHIRLVKVHRDSSQSRLIHCHFVAYPLAACPPYIALSYTWNCSSSASPWSASSAQTDSSSSNSSNAPKETKKETILLQSHPCAIGQNLYSFLRRVRRDSHDRLYWIDALCINQADNAERSHQVRLMRDIYSSAARVIVWLGEATPDNYATIHLLEAAYRGDSSTSGLGRSGNGSTASLNSNYFNSSSNNNNNNTSSNSITSGSPSSSPRIGSTTSSTTTSNSSGNSAEISLSAADKQHIASLYEHEYWSRVWIVQEVICARELVVYWGKRTIRWECIAAHVCGWETSASDQGSSGGSGNSYSKSTALGAAGAASTTLLQRLLASTPAAIIIRTRAAWDGAVPLAQLVTTYRHLRSSDVRDKVFGLLGLASDKRALDQDEEMLYQNNSTKANNATNDDNDNAMKDDASPDEDEGWSGAHINVSTSTSTNTNTNTNKIINGMVPALQADYSMRPEDVFEATCRVAFCSPYLSNHYDRVQFGKALREALAVPFTDRRLDELARQVVGLPVRNRARGHRRHDNGGVGRGRGRGSGARQYSLKQQQKIYRIQRQQQEQKQDKQQNPKPRQWMPSRRDSTTSLSAASASLSKRQATASRSRVRDRAVKRTERTERYLLRGPSLGEKEFGMSGLNLSDEMAER